MLFFEETSKKYKELFTNIAYKIPIFNRRLREKETVKINKSVEQFVELKKIHATPNAVIIEIQKIFSLENNNNISTKPRNEIYNEFLKFCWKNKNENDLLPESKKVQEALKINKQERLDLQARAVEEEILIKAGNNKIFFSKNFNTIDEVLKELES